MLKTWNRTINLVSTATLADGWSRHVEDCLQLLNHAPRKGDWCDVGTGAGLPGVVIAIAGGCCMSVTLYEADKRKCEFLRAVRRSLDLDFRIENTRLDLTAPVSCDVLTARAVAPLKMLLGLLNTRESRCPVGLFLKGHAWTTEVSDARAAWNFKSEAIASVTNPTSVILKVSDVTPR